MLIFSLPPRIHGYRTRQPHMKPHLFNYDLIFHNVLEHKNVIMYTINISSKIFKVLTAQKMKCFIKDSFSKCDKICRKLQTLSHLLKKFLMENFSLVLRLLAWSPQHVYNGISVMISMALFYVPSYRDNALVFVKKKE